MSNVNTNKPEYNTKDYLEKKKEAEEKAYLERKQNELIEAANNPLAVKDLNASEKQIVSQILDAQNRNELKDHFELFSINQSKKNALRIIKLNSLLEKVEDQAIARFEKKPDQVSNKELLDYMNTVSAQIDRAQKQVDEFIKDPEIKIAAQKNEVNINVTNNHAGLSDGLDRDSREKVVDAISALLNQVKNSQVNDLNNIKADKEEPIDIDQALDNSDPITVKFKAEDDEGDF